MNKTTIISVTLGILVVAGLVMFTSPGERSLLVPEAVASEISVDRDMHDFGEIDIFGGKVQSDFILTNTGTQDVSIMAATTSCGCTDGSIAGLDFGMHQQLAKSVVIPAGGSEAVTAIYDPLAHGPNGTGKITRQLFLKTNSETTPEVEVRISADVYKNE